MIVKIYPTVVPHKNGRQRGRDMTIARGSNLTFEHPERFPRSHLHANLAHAPIFIIVTPSDRFHLEEVVRDRNVPQKQVWRAEIVLLSADGLGTN